MGEDRPRAVIDPTRTAVRFPIHLSVTIETESGRMPATTIDISASGVLFAVDTLPPIGSKIEFTVTLPADTMGNTSDVTVHCIGRIVRHESAAGSLRAAAVIDDYTLKA